MPDLPGQEHRQHLRERLYVQGRAVREGLTKMDPFPLGNAPAKKPMKFSLEEMGKIREDLAKVADWAKAHPGTAGAPESLLDGGPGDSDCISTFLASIFHAAGMKTRFVLAGAEKKEMGAQGIYVEVFHPTYGPEGAWIAVLPFAPFIFEGPQILASPRIMQYDL